MARRPKEEIERSLLERRQALAEANLARERALADRQTAIARKNQERVDRIDREIKLRGLRSQERDFINWLREAMLSGQVPVDYDCVRDAITAVLVNAEAVLPAPADAAIPNAVHHATDSESTHGVHEIDPIDLMPFRGTIGELFGTEAEDHTPPYEDHRL